jgi:hypothetical protein
MEWKNPILFGAAVYSHPIDDPSLLARTPVRKVLVPGAWMRDMCRPYWGNAVAAWPVGIDTDLWQPNEHQKPIDVLIYDKIRWNRNDYEPTLLAPIREVLTKGGHSFFELRYGNYREEEFHALLTNSATMIFLCEHETQGIAYQQALACNVPILAWDRKGYWRDPSYYPKKVKFAPVTSIPYWDERCGDSFERAEEVAFKWEHFWQRYLAGIFKPREYILETLTLERCAQRYLDFVREVS